MLGGMGLGGGLRGLDGESGGKYGEMKWPNGGMTFSRTERYVDSGVDRDELYFELWGNNQVLKKA